MNVHLVVTIPFSDFQRGDVITDADLVEAYRDSPNVVRVATPAVG